MEGSSRRSFLLSVGAVAAASAARPLFGLSAALKSPFRIAVINDEISQDFDHVCSVVAHDFGLSWIELRSMWGKNTMDLSDDQIAESKKILAKVTKIIVYRICNVKWKGEIIYYSRIVVKWVPTWDMGWGVD